MAGLSSYVKEQIATQYFQGGSTYAACFSSGQELARDGGYRRVPIGSWGYKDGAVVNGSEISFPMAKKSWGKIDTIVIFDSADGGHEIVSLPLAKADFIDPRQQVKFAPGDLAYRLEQ